MCACRYHQWCATSSLHWIHSNREQGVALCHCESITRGNTHNKSNSKGLFGLFSWFDTKFCFFVKLITESFNTAEVRERFHSWKCLIHMWHSCTHVIMCLNTVLMIWHHKYNRYKQQVFSSMWRTKYTLMSTQTRLNIFSSGPEKCPNISLKTYILIQTSLQKHCWHAVVWDVKSAHIHVTWTWYDTYSFEALLALS